MRKIASGIALTVSMLQGQPIQGLLLPQARHIVGVVVDAQGTPVPGALIDNQVPRLRQTQVTNADGRFELETRAPVLIIRKTGFRSELIRTQDAPEVRVMLRELSETKPFSACSNTGSYEGIDGWRSLLQFPKIADVKVSAQGQDIDYGFRSYYVETRTGPKGIRHGSGPMWSFGRPVDQDVWRSITYEETTYTFGTRMILDARGKMADGNRWRYLGTIGESASYSDVDEATAKVLDTVLDGACMKPAGLK